MSGTLGFPMLPGMDAASYAANSSPQNSVLLHCRPILEKAIATQMDRSFVGADHLMADRSRKKRQELPHGLFPPAPAPADHDDDDGSRVFRIADMGSSSGPNCLANMQFMAQAIRKYYEIPSSAADQLVQHRQPGLMQLQCFFCDLPTNDFNTLFQLQSTHYPQLRQYAQHGPQGSLISGTAAVAGTVYGRLFPASSLHLVFSSCCLHWLSQVPESVSIPNTIEWNKGKIWVDGPLANEAAGRAYAQQWQDDMTAFFAARLEEMVVGAMMFLIIPCRPNHFPPHQMQRESCFRNLELAWKQLIGEGLLKQRDLDSFNIPKYLPTMDEISKAVNYTAKLRIQSLEEIGVAIGNKYWRQWSDEPEEWATRAGQFYKSAFWNVMEPHVGTTNCEAIFKRFKGLLKSSLQNQPTYDPYWAHPWSSYAVLQVFKTL